MDKNIAYANVTVTLKVRAEGSWGDECTIKQINKQAKESALGAIRRGLQNNRFSIIGDPKVDTVTIQRN